MGGEGDFDILVLVPNTSMTQGVPTMCQAVSDAKSHLSCFFFSRFHNFTGGKKENDKDKSSEKKRPAEEGVTSCIVLLSLAASSSAVVGPTIMDKSVDTFEQNKRFLSASFRNFKKHLFCR